MTTRLRKQDIIAEMLRHYGDAQETLNGPADLAGSGDRVPTMPDTWTREYQELHRCMCLLRKERPNQYWHVSERYLRTQRRRIPVILLRNGDPKLPPHTELESIAPLVRGSQTHVIVRQWSKAVSAEKTRRGLDFLASNFNGEPSIPTSLRAVLAA